MRHCRFPFSTVNLCVQIEQTVRDAQTDVERLMRRQRVRRSVQMVEERTERMILRHQPQLSTAGSAGHVAADISQNVVVSGR